MQRRSGDFAERKRGIWPTRIASWFDERDSLPRRPVMKVLLAHNYYGSGAPSGENQVLEAERNLLQQHGHTVTEFARHSDTVIAKGGWGVLQAALATPWNPFAARSMRQTLDEIQPRVVHVHNTFPLISPSIFHAIGNRAARVLTLHNYRLFCPAAIPMRNGRVCTDCLQRRSVVPAMLHGCYRGSRMATAPLAANVALHSVLGTWTRHVDAFIALTEFQRERMVEAGLPAEVVHVKPNFFPGNPVTVHWSERRKSVVFAGRLTAEKGVVALVDAWLKWGPSAPELRILGDGGLRDELEQRAAATPKVPIRFLGQVSGDQAQNEISQARLLVLPSEWFEGFPMVVREAFAFGTPAAVSNIGPLPSIVKHGENGMVFASGDSESLQTTLRTAWESDGELERLGAGARRSFETMYTEEANYQILTNIYDNAIEVSRRRKQPTL